MLTRRDLIRGGVATGCLIALAGPAGRVAAADRPSLRPGGPPQLGPWRVLAGSLHDHSTDSDGDSSSAAVTHWLHAHRAELGIDFITLSDHSDFFPTSPLGDQRLGAWSRQHAIEQRYGGRDFSFIRGFEWTNDQQNHLNVLLSSKWTSRFTTGDAWLNMTPFWEWFSLPSTIGGGDGIGQFNHPGDKGALNWDDYALDLRASRRMCTIEIHGSQGQDGRASSDAGWYWFALAKGWHVSPVMNWDWHDWSTDKEIGNPTPGSAYGIEGHLPGQRTLVLATDARRSSIRNALLGRRTSATEIPDFWAAIRGGVPKRWQGATVALPADRRLHVEVDTSSATERVTRIDIVGDAGVSPYPYYYGDNNWATNHDQLTPSYLLQHERYVSSDGHATRKARIDGPPPGTVLASRDVDGDGTYSFDVAIPDRPSPRPDGKHFVYAIAYAGPASNPARCWTGPLLVRP